MANIRELALRLAWYIDQHGPIPDRDQVKLFAIAKGHDRSHEAEKLRALTEDIVEHFGFESDL